VFGYLIAGVITMKLAAIASIICSVLCAASIAESRQRILIPSYKVSINYATTENTELVSNAIKKAYLFFKSFGYSETYYFEIVFQKEVLVETVNGDFIRVYGKLGKDNCIYLTEWKEPWLEEQNSYGLKMSKEFYESLIVHEVAHLVAEKIAGRKIETAHSEYIAYVVQLSQMHPELRQAILSKRPQSAFETEAIDLEVMLIDPSAFAVKAYLHHTEGEGQFLKEILNGATMQFKSVANRHFH
jgi:hypothetical protein